MCPKRPSGKTSIKSTARRSLNRRQVVADEAADPAEAVEEEEAKPVELVEAEEAVDAALPPMLLPKLDRMLPSPRQNRMHHRQPILLLPLQFLQPYVRRRVLGARKKSRQLLLQPLQLPLLLPRRRRTL